VKLPQVESVGPEVDEEARFRRLAEWFPSMSLGSNVLNDEDCWKHWMVAASQPASWGDPWRRHPDR